MEGFREFFYDTSDGYTNQEVVQLYLNSKDKIKVLKKKTVNKNKNGSEDSKSQTKKKK